MQAVLHVVKTFIGNCNREEKSLRHIPMVAKRHLKGRFALFQTSLILFLISFICQMLAKFSGLNPKGPYVSLQKEKQNFCVVLSYSTKGAREKNCPKCVMHVQRFLSANLNILFFLLLAVAIARTPCCCHPEILLPW